MKLIITGGAGFNGDYFAVSWRNWSGNYQNTVNLAQKLDLHVNINPDIMPVAPYGDIFWFRAKALQKAIGYGFKYEDFDVKYKPDFTILHAIERIYGFAAQDSGYYYAEVINSDDARSDLVNYQYMLYTLCDKMLKNGHNPYNFEMTKQIVEKYKGQPLSLKLYLKMKLKSKLPNPLWEVARKIYHTFK